MARALAKAVEGTRPVEARLVRVHDCLWLRMWRRRQTGPLPELGSIRDVIVRSVRIESGACSRSAVNARGIGGSGNEGIWASWFGATRR